MTIFFITRQAVQQRVALLMMMVCSMCTSQLVTAQAKLVMNGGVINITNGAALVIDNPDNTALTYSGSGYIQSEGENNKIIWTIGAGNGSVYLVPFGNATNYFPVQFNAASGAGANGQFIFSTYPTPTWKNSDYLPAGITNVNGGGIDNSAKVIDRFWQINPQGYTTKPSLTNLSLTYNDGEYSTPNTINEGNFIAQRWNSVLKSWSDYIPSSSVNTSTNTVSMAAIAGSQLYDWWTLVDLSSPLPITLVHFKVTANNGQVHTSWQTVFEQNSDHFEIWRSKDAQQYEYVGSLAAAGSSSGLLNYVLTDAHPYSGTSYYKLKSIDKDGSSKWSAVVSITINDARPVFLYPNPANNYTGINSSLEIVSKKPVARLYDAKGSLLQTFTITSPYQVINTSALPGGAYQISISYNNEIQTLRFIKK